MICPKCGFEQETAEECYRCGIVFAKFRTDRVACESPPCPPKLNAAFFLDKLKAVNRAIGMDWRESVYGLKAACIRWIEYISDLLIEIGMMTFLTSVWYTMVLFMAKAFWYLYLETHVGQAYQEHFYPSAHTISSLFAFNPLLLSMDLTLAGLKMCLLCGIVSQLTFFTRYFFYGRGVISKIIFCGLCCALTAREIFELYYVSLVGAFWLGAIPSLMLFGMCFRITSQLVPELNVVALVRYIRDSVTSPKLWSMFYRIRSVFRD